MKLIWKSVQAFIGTMFVAASVLTTNSVLNNNETVQEFDISKCQIDQYGRIDSEFIQSLESSIEQNSLLCETNTNGVCCCNGVCGCAGDGGTCNNNCKA